MKHYHILTAMSGEQASQAALLHIDAAAADAIREARQALTRFKKAHGGTPSLNHRGTYGIHFLSDIPEGFVDGVNDIQDLYDNARLLPDFDDQTFLEALDEAGHYQRSEVTGLKIYADSIYIIGKERDSSEDVESYDISPMINKILAPFHTA